MTYDVLDKGFVRYVDHMGSDLTVVNAARVSFNKRSKGRMTLFHDDGRIERTPTESDSKLINYLARHKHWTPFGHCCATVHLKMPIFVARQWMRSNVGIVYNEVSRRYVDDEPEFYEPTQWRGRPDGSIKQGSGQDIIPYPLEEYGICPDVRGHYTQAAEYQEVLLHQYRHLLKLGVAPEMARMVLPLSMYTEIWMTASLAALARVCSLRTYPHAQLETQLYAYALSTICKDLWPVSWRALILESLNET